jgi:methionyl-tRNA formyltransferase
MVLTPTPVKAWAMQEVIPTLEPTSLKEKELLAPLTTQTWDLFVVVAYGAIMPKWLLDLPKFGTLNLHPSLLPKLRGASPIRTSILEGYKDTGVTIMLMDEKMDHGPILAQQQYEGALPIRGMELDTLLAKQGAQLLCDTIAKWIAGAITPREQEHELATFSAKITKEMGELALDPKKLPNGTEAVCMLSKIYAFDGWPGTFFFCNGKRIKIIDAHIENDALVISRVIPEGKKEMDFSQFVQNIQ